MTQNRPFFPQYVSPCLAQCALLCKTGVGGHSTSNQIASGAPRVMNCLAGELSSMAYKLPGCRTIHSRKITTFSLLRGTNRISFSFFSLLPGKKRQSHTDGQKQAHKRCKFSHQPQILGGRKRGRPERTQRHNKISQAESTYANLLLINVGEVLGHEEPMTMTR